MDIPGPLRGHATALRLVGEVARGLEMCALDDVRTRSLAVSGVDLLHGSIRQITMSSSKRSPSLASVVVLFGN